MLQTFISDEDGKLTEKDCFSDGCWVSMIAPTGEELERVSKAFGVDIDDLRAPLDEEERSRLMTEDNYTLILVDIPTIEDERGKEGRYITIPLGIVLTSKAIITVCLEENDVLKCFTEGRVRGFYTFKKTRVILQILYRNATLFLQYLELEKSLVYFTTSLRSNEVVLEKMLRTEQIKKYTDDEDLLEDVIIENKQAIEMAGIYSGILSGMMDAFASVISNNLNIVMKLLATITIVLSIPTMIASFFGMNFDNIPFGHHPQGFIIISLITCALTGLVALICAKKKMF